MTTAKEIIVKNFKLCSDYGTFSGHLTKPHDKYVVNVSLTDIKCNCDLSFSKYFKGDNIEYGSGVTAFDRSFELALSIMSHGDNAQIEIELSEKFAGEEVKLLCNAVLHVISESKPIYQWESKEKIEYALHLKLLATEEINKSKPNADLNAFALLVKALQYLDIADTSDLHLEMQCLSNLALLHLRMNNFKKVVILCNDVIENDISNLKLFYRRAVAQTHLQNFELAKNDLVHILKENPHDKLVLHQLSLVEEKLKNLDKKYANAMKKMFL